MWQVHWPKEYPEAVTISRNGEYVGHKVYTNWDQQCSNQWQTAERNGKRFSNEDVKASDGWIGNFNK